MKIAWSGQHTRGKALPIFLRALAYVFERGMTRPEDIEVHVLGVGVMTETWKKLANKLGVDKCFVWHGWLQKSEAVNIVANADVFVITSIKDLTSTVLLEALSAGKPVVCLDHCGFSDVVDASCGIKIPVGVPRDVIKGFARAIESLKNDEYRKSLSKGALKRAAEYQWAKKWDVLKNVYGDGRKKVLVSVYACSPYRGSEPGMGWNYLKLIAERNEVWTIVEEEKWRKDIEKYLNEHPEEMKSVRWTFIHKPRARFLRKIWPPSYYWFYRIWQWRAYKKALEFHKEVKFDIVHQLNMVGFREPGYLWKMDVPFVWGPVGGLGYTDIRLFPLLGFAGSLEFSARNIINWLQCHLMLRPKFAARKAAKSKGLFAATDENRMLAKSLWGVEANVLCEIGCETNV